MIRLVLVVVWGLIGSIAMVTLVPHVTNAVVLSVLAFVYAVGFGLLLAPPPLERRR